MCYINKPALTSNQNFQSKGLRLSHATPLLALVVKKVTFNTLLFMKID